MFQEQYLTKCRQFWSRCHFAPRKAIPDGLGPAKNVSNISYASYWTLTKAVSSLPGPPLTNDTTLVKLLESGVIVGLGVRDAWEARNTRFDLQWVSSTGVLY